MDHGAGASSAEPLLCPTTASSMIQSISVNRLSTLGRSLVAGSASLVAFARSRAHARHSETSREEDVLDASRSRRGVGRGAASRSTSLPAAARASREGVYDTYRARHIDRCNRSNRLRQGGGGSA
jgi:hypothetical protein